MTKVKPKTFKQIMYKLVNQSQILSGTEEEINDMEMLIHDLIVENQRLVHRIEIYSLKIIALEKVIRNLKND